MEKLKKIVIYLVIVMSVTLFALFLYSALPSIIEDSSRNWERALEKTLTEEELKEMFYAESAYTFFKEKYPDAIESFDGRSKGQGTLKLIMYNYTNFNEIRLNIDYNKYNSKVTVFVDCRTTNPNSERDIHSKSYGDEVTVFIEKIDCLNSNVTSPYLDDSPLELVPPFLID